MLWGRYSGKLSYWCTDFTWKMLKKILSILLVAVISLGGGYFYLRHAIEAEVERTLQRVAEAGGYQSISYEGMRLSLNGDITLDNLLLLGEENQEYLWHTVVISDYDWFNDVPRHAMITARGLEFPRGLQLQRETGQVLRQYLAARMENGALPLTLRYQYTYDPESAGHIQGNMSLDLERAARVDFSSVIRGIPLESLFSMEESNPEAARLRLISYLFDARIPKASMKITDHGMVDAMIERAAAENNLPPDQFRQSLIAQAQNLHYLAPQSLQGFARDAGGEIARFLEGSRALSISLEPEHDGHVQQLQTEIMAAFLSQQFGRIIELLNLNVSTTEDVA